MESKYVLDTKENKSWLVELCNELLEFGRHFSSPGGSSYYLSDDGTPWKDRPRETWITSRMAHVYSIGAILNGSYDNLKNADYYGKLADAALSGLRGELYDDVNGGWYAGITSAGGILESKQCYAHAFVILAATSGILAGREGAKELLSDALSLYDRYFWDEEEGLSVDAWNTEFTKLSDYRGINANMHTVETFLAVYDVLGDSTYLERAGRIIGRVIKWSADNNWRIPEHYMSDWTPDLECQKETPDDPFKPYGATPGHGIEWARLITQWSEAMCDAQSYNGKVMMYSGTQSAGRRAVMRSEVQSAGRRAVMRPEAQSAGRRAVMHPEAQSVVSNVKPCHEENDREIEDQLKVDKCIEAAENLYNRAIDDAWNSDGDRGIVYTTDWEGKPVVHDRMHWTLAEAINTSAVLYRKTGNESYASNYSEFMKYLDEVVHDKVNGSWFHQLDRNNNVIGTVWPGKSDIYHAMQATLIPYNTRIGMSIAKAVKEGYV